MSRRGQLLLLLLLQVGSASADLYRVRNTRDTGDYSLRWAITEATNRPGRDKIVFAPRLAGRSIVLATALPAVSDARTVIDGDIDGDGAPDIAINGRNLVIGDGLKLNGRNCTVRGLAIVNFPSNGIELGSAYSTVRGCHIGVNLPGTAAARNGSHDILMYSYYNTIGGATTADRNVIAGGDVAVNTSGIYSEDSAGNLIYGNTFGLKRNGLESLGGGYCGVRVNSDGPNYIGGAGPGQGNVFGGLETGIELSPGMGCEIAGNYFGLGTDGNTTVAIGNTCIYVTLGSRDNVIGGKTDGARNIFGAAHTALRFVGPAPGGDKVQGNYFGLNAAGTQQKRLLRGIFMIPGTGTLGAQLIGGGTAKAGNYFTAKSTSPTPYGIHIVGGAGDGTVIRNNKFGVRPDGHDARGMHFGIYNWGAHNLYIDDNLFARLRYGLNTRQSGSNPRLNRNTFRNCFCAVQIEMIGRCRLGNLGNTSAADDGGNRFRRSNTWHIRNQGPYKIMAEGNNFGTTLRSEINAKIWDRREGDGYGRVDFSPLMGGVLPAGYSAGVLAITTATAVPADAGAEIVFSLTAPGDVTVTVRNVAGRSVKTLCRGKQCEAGTTTLLWNAEGDGGVRVPSGVYLVDIAAKAADGTQARALASLSVNR